MCISILYRVCKRALTRWFYQCPFEIAPQLIGFCPLPKMSAVFLHLSWFWTINRVKSELKDGGGKNYGSENGDEMQPFRSCYFRKLQCITVLCAACFHSCFAVSSQCARPDEDRYKRRSLCGRLQCTTKLNDKGIVLNEHI